MKTLLLAALIALPTTASADEIVWQTEKARAQGTGCNSDPTSGQPADTFFVSNGNDVSAVFSKLSIYLPGNGPSLALRESKSCHIAIPAEVMGGYFVGEVIQDLSFGIVTSPHASAAVDIQAAFFNHRVNPLRAAASREQPTDMPRRLAESTHRFPRHHPLSRQLCNSHHPHARKGGYVAQIQVTGERASPSESVIVSTDALDLRFDVLMDMQECNGR